MGSMDLDDFDDFKKEINTLDHEWFFGSEEYLWNAAIERNLPQMERIIQKKNG